MKKKAESDKCLHFQWTWRVNLLKGDTNIFFIVKYSLRNVKIKTGKC